MDNDSIKSVMVIDSSLPVGILANTAAILGVSLGKLAPEQVGPDIVDASGQIHLGIVSLPLTILRADEASLRELRSRLYGPEFKDCLVIDFPDVARSCNVYSKYAAKMADTSQQDQRYLGIAIYGNKKQVNRLTGSIALL